MIISRRVVLMSEDELFGKNHNRETMGIPTHL